MEKRDLLVLKDPRDSVGIIVIKQLIVDVIHVAIVDLDGKDMVDVMIPVIVIVQDGGYGMDAEIKIKQMQNVGKKLITTLLEEQVVLEGTVELEEDMTICQHMM